MQRAMRASFVWQHLCAFVALVMVCGAPTGMQAQHGWKAVIASGQGAVSPSFASVDAVTYANDSRCGTSCDICQRIFYALTDFDSNSQGLVIDARGVQGAALTCASSDVNPWLVLASLSSTFPNTVLLPAGTIKISSTWILPADTRITGEGPNSTIITTFGTTFGGDLIDMGSESGLKCSTVGNAGKPDCPGIVIEHLGIQGNVSGAVTGTAIVNCCAQEFSRVSDVAITNVATGLALTDLYAENSGPYTNLTISNVNTCLAIGLSTSGDVPGTRGVHGLTCMTNGASPAAITLDGANNSLEDINIQGTSLQDGVLIGSQAAAHNNILFNIHGNGLKNVIHISSNSISGVPNVSDLTILGVAHTGGMSAIEDDVTPNLTSTSTVLGDLSVGMYVIGEPVQSGGMNVGNSRFTTSINVPTWLVGPNQPSNNCAAGDLYSCTGITCSSSGTLWQCLGGGTTWGKIK